MHELRIRHHRSRRKEALLRRIPDAQQASLMPLPDRYGRLCVETNSIQGRAQAFLHRIGYPQDQDSYYKAREVDGFMQIHLSRQNDPQYAVTVLTVTSTAERNAEAIRDLLRESHLLPAIANPGIHRKKGGRDLIEIIDEDDSALVDSGLEMLENYDIAHRQAQEYMLAPTIFQQMITFAQVVRDRLGIQVLTPVLGIEVLIDPIENAGNINFSSVQDTLVITMGLPEQAVTLTTYVDSIKGEARAHLVSTRLPDLAKKLMEIMHELRIVPLQKLAADWMDFVYIHPQTHQIYLKDLVAAE